MRNLLNRFQNKRNKRSIWEEKYVYINLKSQTDLDFILFYFYLLLKQLCSESYEVSHLFYGNNTKKNVEFPSSNLILLMWSYGSDDA